MAAKVCSGVKFDDDAFVDLLEKLIGESKHLQNHPPHSVPKEDRAVRHVMDVLRPYTTDEGGPLEVKHIAYHEGRGNVIITYPGEEGGPIMSFVGCHMDVVPANPETWDTDPFKLIVEGDKLIGRGTTDCLGHVSLVTQLFAQLAKQRPKLKITVVGVLIANEENSRNLGVGVDELVRQGEMDHLKNGPLFWVDTADKCPCIGTGGIATWTLRATGRLFHSGIPHHAINPIELNMEALAEIQRRFYEDFPPHPQEAVYGFRTCSTIKPTQVHYPTGSVNQIPGEMSISGDLRITPFYDVYEVKQRVTSYVEDINKDVTRLPCRGPVSKYELPEEGLKGTVEITWGEGVSPGYASKLDSPGFYELCGAFTDVLGSCQPMAITGSLPCIKDLQDEGYDVQTTGFGLMRTYHANNEYAFLSDFRDGFNVLLRLVERMDNAA
eukprot:CAMPEP_0118927854 /NCGR_PEP_ID=MMETSP1169-20130426/5242_1 /TAXON_ID=36882 /ORGANISM="Pyramimonas obovata, Strain CCMP722" /LENGTH=437 /DNA_ID=CAMNT_0006869711 /DNA_START=69 /DNA_END=1378 /DNA_ORIENTATION=+